MDRLTFQAIDDYMQATMKDSAHDYLHIYRVLGQALNIAEHYPEINRDVLIAACLLHDIGRVLEDENPDLCHAVEGGKQAYAFLRDLGCQESLCVHVQDCITTHRYRTDRTPVTLEAQILFDADKLDAARALGIARTLNYGGKLGEPLYTADENHQIFDGSEEDAPQSFLREYHFKLNRVYERFYTPEAEAIAAKRRASATQFYHDLLHEAKIGEIDIETILT